MKIEGKDLFLNTKVSSLTELKSDSGNKLVISGFANTTGEDRAGDVIVENAWHGDALVNYLKNPIILAFHNHSTPIGVMVDYVVSSKGLEITAEISESAGNVYNLIKEGILQAFSVGFRVKDAEYDSTTDIFVIKELELHEVSVVSVPCNQDSVFSVAKSFDTAKDYTEYKAQFIKQSEGSTEPTKSTQEELDTMDPKDLEKQANEIKAAVQAALKAQTDAATELAAKEQAKKDEESRIVEMVKSGAEALVAELTSKSEESAKEFNETVKSLRDDLAAKSEEIKAIQKNKSTFHSKGDTLDKAFESDISDAVLMSKLLNKDVLETKSGINIREKINTSSSYEVSSIGFETIFSNSLERDIQDLLVVAPLFREILMPSSTMTLPIRPDAVTATWVNPTAYGAAGSTGSEIAIANTEISLVTKKLAAKAFLTDETDEDVLQAMLPIIRDSLVEAQAKSLDLALISAAGSSNDPKGLIPRAITAGGAFVTEHTKLAAGGSLIAAKDLIVMRRALGQRGLTLNNLALVVNLDCYWDLLEDPAFDNLNEVGSQAHLLTGQVGKLHGLPVQVSTQFPAVANGSVFAMLIDKTNFLLPRQRGITVQTDYDVETQSRILVATQRVGFAEIIDGVAVATMTYDADGV